MHIRLFQEKCLDSFLICRKKFSPHKKYDIDKDPFSQRILENGFRTLFLGHT